MTLIFHNDARKARKKSSSKNTDRPRAQTIAHTGHGYPSQLAVNVQAPPYQPQQSPPVAYANAPWADSPPLLHPEHARSPQPQAYGPPQLQPQPHPVYGYMPTAQGSPPFGHPSQSYIGDSTVTFAEQVSPQRERGGLKAPLHKLNKMASRSYTDLRGTLSSGANKSSTAINQLTTKTTDYVGHSATLISKKSTQALNQGAAFCDMMCDKLNAVITSIDEEQFSGNESELEIQPPPYEPYDSMSTLQPESARGVGRVYQGAAAATGGKSSNHFAKVWLYANSRLPPHLPPFKVYIPTYPLLCLAAQYSERVYTPPKASNPSEKASHVAASIRSGTKAMVLKSIPVDDMNTIVFAIRGSQTFMDWAVNFRPAPDSPQGFLDDPGNLCHSGFLHVARQMVVPVAERLRTLLEENPGRSTASLLITGHSAGGAVASLLFAHMLSTTVTSELTHLSNFFKRVHCVTFGAPPVSLLPLQKPDSKRHKKSLFFSFVNEGDPVPRADKTVIRSLLKLYASAAPNSTCGSLSSNLSKLNLSSTTVSKQTKFSKSSKATTASVAPFWPIPTSTLSTAGRLVILRRKSGGGGTGKEDDIEAVVITDADLRDVVFGDPVMHMMTVYAKRIELLATRAVTAQF